MTIRQKLFFKKYFEFGNATEAAMQVYNVKKRSTAAQIGYENLRKPDIKQALRSYFERAERTPIYAAGLL